MAGPKAAVLAAMVFLAACTARYQPMGPATEMPRLTDTAVLAADGYRLPLRQWRPEAESLRAVVVALHGFNDYSQSFSEAAEVWAEDGILTYAYDQRGFGESVRPGIWAGSDTLAQDLTTTARLVRARHPRVPLYLVGESMGAAVALTALTGDVPPPADGAVLVAPAVWGRADMSLIERVALWWAVTATPGLAVTGDGLDIAPSDNVEMLRRLGRDPLVIKETRADAVGGLVDLMERAAASAGSIDHPLLVLYGDNEEIIPSDAIARFLARLPPQRAVVAFYPNGYHMLLRDRAGHVVIGDVAHWVTVGGDRLPSGHQRRRPDYSAEGW